MKIKANTKKLLIWMYKPEDPKRLIPIEHINYLWPQLSSAGKKSLCRYLKEKELIDIVRDGVGEKLILTNYGRSVLEDAFPNLRSFWGNWRGQWLGIVLLNSPSQDPEFRQLRSLLKKYGAIPLTRAVYLCSEIHADKLTSQLLNNYYQSVYIWRLGSLIFGNDKKLFSLPNESKSALLVYSKISNEVSDLLDKKQEKKALTNRQKTQIFSIFNRLFDLIENCSGVFTIYFPETETISELMNIMHGLF